MCDVNKIWATMLADESFTDQIPEGAPRDVVRATLVDPAPTVFAAVLDKPLTLASLTEARLAAARHMVTSDFGVKLLEALPPELMPPGPKAKAVVAMRETAKEAQETLEKAAEQVVDLPPGGMTEELMTVHYALDALEQNGIDASTLTIRDLVEQHPGLVYGVG